MHCGKSLIYSKNKAGPSTEPSGTPHELTLPTEEIVTFMRERAKRMSASKYICIHTIKAVPFYYLWHGTIIRQYNDKTLIIEKNL